MIEKMLLIYIQTGLPPSIYFEKNPPKAIINKLPIFDIYVNRELLRKRIEKRTQKMLDMGLIGEVCELEYKYTRFPNALKAIGIIEVFEYLDGMIDKAQMKELIITHTSQLAKRQQTFNKTQFPNRKLLDTEEIYKDASAFLKAKAL